MIDIISTTNGLDIGVYDTNTTKAANVLSVQLGALEYAPDLGIDLNYFLSEDFRFQNESFKSYCVNILAQNGINVTEVLDENQSLFSDFIFNISPNETTTGLIAR